VSKLLPVDYDKVVKALVRIGYIVNNQRGSHIVMRLAEKEKYASLFGYRKNEVMIVIPARPQTNRKRNAENNHQGNRPLG